MIRLLIGTVRRTYLLLPKHLRKRSFLVLLGLLVNSVLDLIGLAVLIPIIILVLEDNAVQENQILVTVYDYLGFESSESFILVLCGSILITVILKNILSLFIQFYQSRFSYDLNRYFASRLFSKLHNWGFLKFKSKNSGYFLRNINGIPSDFSTNIFLPILNVITELVVLVFITAGLLWYYPRVLGLVILVVTPTFTLLYLMTKNKIKEVAEDLDRIRPLISQLLIESIQGYVEVKINRKLNEYSRKYNELLMRITKLQSISYVFKQMPTKVVETSMILGVLVIIGFGIFFFDDRTELVTLLSVFALAAYRTLPSVNRMMVGMVSIKGYQYCFDALERISEIYEEEEQSKTPIEFKEKIQFNNVKFRYPGKDYEAISGLNLDIMKGETIGVVGKSGSGKTTLVNLGLLVLTAQSGSFLVDGVELGVQNQQEWYKLVGYVPQDVFILDKSVAQNVAFGEDDIDEDLVLSCLKKASLAEYIYELKDGIHSEIGENGAMMSGGQRQRLGIARALYSGAQILIFDEATSALDNETEKEITDAIYNLSKNQYTVIIVAHRVTTLKYCDRIIKLEKGKVASIVNYQDLLAQTL